MSPRAAYVEVAFLSERLCFANLTLSFLEVLILALRSNKEPSEYTVHLDPLIKTKNRLRSLFEFWQVATLMISSRRCAGRRTAICCAGPLLSLLRPLAMLWIKYHIGPSPRPKLRGDEQRAGGAPHGVPKKRHWTAIQGGQDTGPRPRALPDRY